MAIGSVGPAQSQQQIGPVSAQPLTIETQYRRQRLKEDLISMRQAYMATDVASVQMLASNIRAELPGAGLPKAYSDRILQDVNNPGPGVLTADNDYLKALTDDDSVFSAATKSTYSSDDLASLNSAPSDNGSGINSATAPAESQQSGANSYLSPQYGVGGSASAPTNGAAASTPSLSNLPQFGTAAPAA